MLNIKDQWDKQADLCLYQGDCIEFTKFVPDSEIQLIITSPPYNIGKPYEKRQPLNYYLDWQEKVLSECVRILKPQGSICWQVGNYVLNGEIVPLDLVLYPILMNLGLKLRNRIVWQFGHGLHASKRFSGRYEVVLWLTKTDDYVFNLDNVRVPQKYPNKRYFKGEKKGQLSCNPLGKNPSDVWDIPNVKSNHIEKTDHPAQFPVELVERLILSMSNEGDWTFDPFMGSGTTQIASVIHDRKSCGAEINPDYYSIAINRIKDAESGKLQIRPMDRPVFDPHNPSSLPPQVVKLKNLNNTQLEIEIKTGNA